jgi:uncharacterized protein (DUF58 family)
MKREAIRLRPTWLWLLFGPILGCIWLAAVNYSNNLVYAILYLVASLTFVSIFHTWRNLAALEIEHVRIHPAFARGDVRMEIHLRNTRVMQAHGLFFAGLEKGMRRRDGLVLRTAHGGGARVRGGDSRTVEVRFPARGRGRYRLETLVVRTTYPFGLVGGSFRLPVGIPYFVYPEAKGLAPFPQPRGGTSGLALSAEAGDDFVGVRSYQAGESLRHVDWKAVARGRPLSVKQFSGGDGRELWLDEESLAGQPLEARLSQLALWIVQAEKQEVAYAFRFGPTTLPPGLGEEHARRALETLAMAD